MVSTIYNFYSLDCHFFPLYQKLPTVAEGKDLLGGGTFSYFIADRTREEDRNVLFWLIHNNTDSLSQGSRGACEQLILISCIIASRLVPACKHS